MGARSSPLDFEAGRPGSFSSLDPTGKGAAPWARAAGGERGGAPARDLGTALDLSGDRDLEHLLHREGTAMAGGARRRLRKAMGRATKTTGEVAGRMVVLTLPSVGSGVTHLRRSMAAAAALGWGRSPSSARLRVAR
jgi:hypothetical protein